MDKKQDNIFDLRPVHRYIAEIIMNRIKKYGNGGDHNLFTVTYGELYSKEIYRREKTRRYSEEDDSREYNDMFNTLTRFNIGDYLERLSLYTHHKYGIFLSAFVVQADTKDKTKRIPMPGNGFMPMYQWVKKEFDELEQAAVEEQRRLIIEMYNDGKLDELIKDIEKITEREN